MSIEETLRKKNLTMDSAERLTKFRSKVGWYLTVRKNTNKLTIRCTTIVHANLLSMNMKKLYKHFMIHILSFGANSTLGIMVIYFSVPLNSLHVDGRMGLNTHFKVLKKYNLIIYF